MPKIIQEDSRVAALNEIEAALGIVQSINALLSSQESQMIITASSTARSGSKVVVDERDSPKLRAILTGQRARLVKEIQAKANRHRILLDERDLACLEGKVREKRQNANSTAVQATEQEETE